MTRRQDGTVFGAPAHGLDGIPVRQRTAMPRLVTPGAIARGLGTLAVALLPGGSARTAGRASSRVREGDVHVR